MSRSERAQHQSVSAVALLPHHKLEDNGGGAPRRMLKRTALRFSPFQRGTKRPSILMRLQPHTGAQVGGGRRVRHTDKPGRHSDFS